MVEVKVADNAVVERQRNSVKLSYDSTRFHHASGSSDCYAYNVITLLEGRMRAKKQREEEPYAYVLEAPKRWANNFLIVALGFMSQRLRYIVLELLALVAILSVVVGFVWALAPDRTKVSIFLLIGKRMPSLETYLDQDEIIDYVTTVDPDFEIATEGYKKRFASALRYLAGSCERLQDEASLAPCVASLNSLWKGDFSTAIELLNGSINELGAERKKHEVGFNEADLIAEMESELLGHRLHRSISTLNFLKHDFYNASSDVKLGADSAKRIKDLANTLLAVADIRAAMWSSETLGHTDFSNYEKAREWLRKVQPDTLDWLLRSEFWRLNSVESVSPRILEETGRELYLKAERSAQERPVSFAWSAYAYGHALSKTENWTEVLKLYTKHKKLLDFDDEHFAWAGHNRVNAEYHYHAKQDPSGAYSILQRVIDELERHPEESSSRSLAHIKRDLAVLKILESRGTGSVEAENLLNEAQQLFSTVFSNKSVWFGYNLCVRAHNAKLLNRLDAARAYSSIVLEEVEMQVREDNHFYCGCRQIFDEQLQCNPL